MAIDLIEFSIFDQTSIKGAGAQQPRTIKIVYWFGRE